MINWRGVRIPELTLGTAQLGMDYGIANTMGQPDIKTAYKMILAAWEKGIRCFDTAQAYGTSEYILGKAIKHLGIGNDALVITKIDSKLESVPVDKIIERIGASRNLLNVPSIFAVLLHNGQWMYDWNKRYIPMFKALKQKGEILFAGVSIDDPDEFEMALSIDDLDIIEIPFNVFDQRGLNYHWFERSKQADKFIFIRSIYLQGLLLMLPDSLPEKMAYVKPALQKYVELCNQEDLTQKEMAMAFAHQHAASTSIIVGSETPDQVENNAKLLIRAKELTISGQVTEAFGGKVDENVFNPGLWPGV